MLTQSGASRGQSGNLPDDTLASEGGQGGQFEGFTPLALRLLCTVSDFEGVQVTLGTISEHLGCNWEYARRIVREILIPGGWLQLRARSIGERDYTVARNPKGRKYEVTEKARKLLGALGVALAVTGGAGSASSEELHKGSDAQPPQEKLQETYYSTGWPTEVETDQSASTQKGPLRKSLSTTPARERPVLSISKIFSQTGARQRPEEPAKPVSRLARPPPEPGSNLPDLSAGKQTGSGGVLDDSQRAEVRPIGQRAWTAITKAWEALKKSAKTAAPGGGSERSATQISGGGGTEHKPTDYEFSERGLLITERKPVKDLGKLMRRRISELAPEGGATITRNGTVVRWSWRSRKEWRAVFARWVVEHDVSPADIQEWISAGLTRERLRDIVDPYNWALKTTPILEWRDARDLELERRRSAALNLRLAVLDQRENAKWLSRPSEVAASEIDAFLAKFTS